jgi:hypothetical protein
MFNRYLVLLLLAAVIAIYAIHRQSAEPWESDEDDHRGLPVFAVVTFLAAHIAILFEALLAYQYSAAPGGSNVSILMGAGILLLGALAWLLVFLVPYAIILIRTKQYTPFRIWTLVMGIFATVAYWTLQ